MKSMLSDWIGKHAWVCVCQSISILYMNVSTVYEGVGDGDFHLCHSVQAINDYVIMWLVKHFNWDTYQRNCVYSRSSIEPGAKLFRLSAFLSDLAVHIRGSNVSVLMAHYARHPSNSTSFPHNVFFPSNVLCVCTNTQIHTDRAHCIARRAARDQRPKGKMW